jgi:hypothetical protein
MNVKLRHFRHQRIEASELQEERKVREGDTAPTCKMFREDLLQALAEGPDRALGGHP